MNNKHKWHDEIVAWAGGAEIECKYLHSEHAEWGPVSPPFTWDNLDYQYRIKPQPKEPKYLYFYRRVDGIYISEFAPQLAPHAFIGKIEVQDD